MIMEIYLLKDFGLKEKKNGIGKEYDEDNNLIFDGEYKEGKKLNGILKNYLNGFLLFEAEILNGKIKTSKTYDEKTKNVLEFRNGNGYTRQYYDIYSDFNILKFEGEFKNGLRNGKGKEYGLLNNIIFEGEYLNGERNGKGKEFFFNGSIKYEGEFSDGKRHGKGKEYDIKGALIFEGEYINDKRKEKEVINNASENKI